MLSYKGSTSLITEQVAGCTVEFDDFCISNLLAFHLLERVGTDIKRYKIEITHGVILNC